MTNRILACFLVALTLVLPLQAQQVTVPNNPPTATTATAITGQVLQANSAGLSASDSGSCATANACVILNLGPLDQTFVVTTGGTFSATAQIEGSTGNGTWAAVACPTMALGASVSSFTATGGWVCNAAGMVQARVRLSSYVSGTAIVGMSSGQGQPGIATSVPQALTSTSTPTFAGVNQTTGNQYNGVASKVFVTTDFTTSGSGTNLERITGLSWALPSTAAGENVGFECDGVYQQNVGQAAVTFGVQTTAAPTNLAASGIMETNTTAVASGGLIAVSTATSSGIMTGTPNAQTTSYMFHLAGHLENPASTANTLTINVKTATAADTVTIKQDSFCRLSY